MPKFDTNRMDLRERLVMLNRCAKVVRGGRRFSYAAVMVVGDGQGHVGIGMGKARETPEAIRKGIEQAKKTLQDTEAQVLIDINTQFRNLREAQELLRVAEALQAARREQTREVVNRYTQQAALLKDVLQERSSLAEANSQHKQALLQFATAQASLEKALGGN